MTSDSPFIQGYPAEWVEKAHAAKARGDLEATLLAHHPQPNDITDNARLNTYVQTLKRTHMKKAPPLSKIRYCEKISTLNRALGLHTYVVRQQGNKLKRKNELRVASVFKDLPKSFLEMIVVHELAHLRHKDHDKAFYRLCKHMLPDYHQLEWELRLMLFARHR